MPPLFSAAEATHRHTDDDAGHGFAPRCESCLTLLTPCDVKGRGYWRCASCGRLRIS